jgi:CIC family chloride channel protein
MNEYVENLFFSIIIGVVVSFSTIFLFEIYSLLQKFASSLFIFSSFFIILIPPIGMSISYLIVNKISETKTTGCGTHSVIDSYLYKSGYISEKDTLSKTLASIITISSGGSAGLEGPSLLLGGGIASFLGKRMNLKPKQLSTIFLCGASAGLSAIFKAPLTGIFFALEIPYKRDLAKEVFIPASISSIISYVIFISIKGSEKLFPSITDFSPLQINMFHLIMNSLFTSLVALFFIRFFKAINKIVSKINFNPLLIAMLGGLIIGILGLFMPQCMGVGYDMIHSLISGDYKIFSIEFLILLLIIKIFVTSITLNFGGSGGLFIPSIYVGATVGALYNKIFTLNEGQLFIIISMAALIAATNKTLLTSIAFVAETIGPSSIIPTTIAASISYLITGVNSFYENQLLEKPIEEEKALAELQYIFKKSKLEILKRIKASQIMTKNPLFLKENMSIIDALEAIGKYRFRIYPILDNEKRIVGYVKIEDLLAIPSEKWNLPIYQIIISKPLIVLENYTLDKIINEMIEKEEDHAFVVENLDSKKLVGIIAGIDIIKKLLEIIKEVKY